jgi:dipeptidyl aminopeptidase/acylaminoacyl peptidase
MRRLFLILVLLPLPVGAQMAPEDYLRLTFVSEPEISPDGSQVAFTVRTVSDDGRSREGAIWLVRTDDFSDPVQLSPGTSDSNPRWSPDGTTISYVSDDAIHLIPAAGGEPQTLVTFRQGSISSHQWAPDGRRILVSLDLDVEVDDPTVEDEAEPGPDIIVVRDALYKEDGRGYLESRRRHLWRVEVPSGRAERLTTGDLRWEDHAPSVSPDGGRVVFGRDRTGEEFDGAHDRGVWFVALDGGTPEALEMPDGRAETPIWAPGNDAVVYRFTPERYTRPHLYLHSIVDNTRIRLTDGVDRVPTNLLWHPSGSHLYYTADRRGTHPLYRIARDGSGEQPLFGEDGFVRDVSVSADGNRLAFTYENERFPPEVWISDEQGRAPRPLTDFNGELLQSLDLRRLEEVAFQNREGFPLQGFILPPHDFVEGERYPLILNIKGGPAGMWGNAWFPEFQMLAAAGYGVAFVNYRGSTGYGFRHQDAVRMDYGGADATDNLEFLDEVLARHDWIDPERLYVTGGSHGGFLTAWLTTRTDRFRAAVTQRMVSNWISEAGTQEYPPRRMADEFGGTIWERFDFYWERSPLAHAPDVTTPTLIIHSDEDMITPIGQGQEWFYALKAVGVETEMVIFRGETHDLSRTGTPINLVERLRRIIDWFERW